jgi:hypothetical protein
MIELAKNKNCAYMFAYCVLCAPHATLLGR